MFLSVYMWKPFVLLKTCVGGLLCDGTGFRVECEIALAIWVKPTELGAGVVICMLSPWDIEGGEH